MMDLTKISLIILLLIGNTAWAKSTPDKTTHATPIYVGLDAEFGYKDSTSAEAIKRGMLIAMGEINQSGGLLGGRQLVLLERANNSTPARSIANIQELANLPDVVAVFCGRFSPTVLESLPVIHQYKIPMLDPWAAADGIIDNQYSPSYVFRLSLRDSWAMQVMIPFAGGKKLHKLGLLLLNTSWGRSNQNAAQAYVKAHPQYKIMATKWFNWSDESLLDNYLQILKAGAETVIFAGNPADGLKLVKAETSLPPGQRLPIISHWGITGGNFAQQAVGLLAQVDFSVVQTYSFIGKQDAHTLRVLAAAQRLFGVSGARALESPVGVAHAYDLTHILAKAITLVGSTDRSKIRDALEQVKNYNGLIKRFPQPFTTKRHEALSLEDVFMARYAADFAIEPLVQPAHTRR